MTGRLLPVADSDVEVGVPGDTDVFRPVDRRRGARPRPAVLAAVFVGGFAGGLARYGVTLAWPPPEDGLPWAIFAVNTAGAFLLAVLLILVQEVWRPSPYVRPLLATGFLGTFTTFSAVATAVDLLVARDRAGLAAGYLVGSVLAGLAAIVLGLLAGRAVAARR